MLATTGTAACSSDANDTLSLALIILSPSFLLRSPDLLPQ